MFVAMPVIPAGPAAGDAEIEKYFDMSVQIRDRASVLARIGDAVIGTESVIAFMLAEHRLADDERE